MPKTIRQAAGILLSTALPLMRAAAAAALAFAEAGPGPAHTEPDAPAGQVEERMVPSRLYGRERRVWVYTPPGYPARAPDGCDLMVAFDGSEYLEQIPLPKILDGLLARGEAGPFVAVLVDNASSAERLADLANHARFADFVSEELVPWARKGWRFRSDARRTIVTGSSAGGLAAAYVAYRRPDVFGNVVSQSGAFWRGDEGSNGPPWEWLTGRIAASPKREIRFWLDVGSKESVAAMGGAAPSILEANRRLREVLQRKGYAVRYAEVENGGHAPEFWRERLPGLIAAAARAGNE